jgi:hypothetical protein
MNFVVWAPPYRNESSGVRVLHRLCHLLNCIGQTATITTEVTHPDWNTPVARAISDETIVVYPEVVIGNPLNAKRVVRYVLNSPGLLGGEPVYDPAEMVFYYDDLFRAVAQAATSEPLADRKLRISLLEPEVFYDDRSAKRTYDCFYVGKGRSLRERAPLPGESAMVHIQSMFPPTRLGLANLLRGCKTLYTYDNVSAIIHEGRVCGARVVFVTDDGLIEYTDDFTGYESDYYDTAKIEHFVELTLARWPAGRSERPNDISAERVAPQTISDLFTAQATRAERALKKCSMLESEIESLRAQHVEQQSVANREMSHAAKEALRMRRVVADERARQHDLTQALARALERADALSAALIRVNAELDWLRNVRALEGRRRLEADATLHKLEAEIARLRAIADNYARLSIQMSGGTAESPTVN